VLSKVLEKATSLVESRFLLVALFPVIVLLAAIVLLLVRLDTSTLSDAERSWAGWTGPRQWLWAVVSIAALFVIAYVVFVSITPLVRVFEGYFGPLAWLGELFGLGKVGGFTGPAVDDPLLYVKHPGNDEHFPTRLGNSLRAAEVHPRDAYGMDSVVLWPRLVAVVPEPLVKSIDGTRMALDFLIVIVAGTSFFSLFAAVAIAVGHGGRALWITVVATSASVAYLAYCGAVAAARDYGDQIRTAFDLHRFELLDALRVPLPMNRSEERRLWSEVNELVRGSEPPDWWLYQHRQPEK
jgi:hypothetical protein